MRKRTLSPKELARAIGASESSVKRWVDDGVIPAARTSGGHRRISLPDAIQFIRDRRAPLVLPELLGLDANTDWGRSIPERSGEHLYELLTEGRGVEARGLLMSLFLEGESLATIFDGPVRESLEQIGNLWRDQEDGIFVEHRACGILLEALTQMRLEFLQVPESEVVAVGGAIEGDQSRLPSMMASLVLNSAGFRTVDLGTNTPLHTLLLAMHRHQARLIWLSVNHLEQAEQRNHELALLVSAVEEAGSTLVVGGRSARGLDLPAGSTCYVAERLGELAALARGIGVSA